MQGDKKKILKFFFIVLKVFYIKGNTVQFFESSNLEFTLKKIHQLIKTYEEVRDDDQPININLAQTFVGRKF